MGFIRNRSIAFKLLSLFFLVVILSAVSHLLVVQKVQPVFLRKQAKSIAGQIVLTRQWIANLGGVWSKDKYSQAHGFLTEYTEGSDQNEPEDEEYKKAVFYLHNPALATREISTLADIKYGYIFRVVSDLFREASNKPDSFEAAAIETMKKDGVTYVDEFQEGTYRYTEPLLVKKGCLRCHGDLETDVKEPMKTILVKKYGNRAFGYKVGDVRGIISIEIPTVSWLETMASVLSVWNLLILVVSILLFYFFAKFIIVKPVIRLSDAATALSKGDMEADMGAKKVSSTSKDEIDMLTLSFSKLQKSYKILSKMVAKQRKK